jgi:Family of unknown function (DUF6932)
MIPSFDSLGNLPAGRHTADWQEFVNRFDTTPQRRALLAGMRRMLLSLKSVGCTRAFMDGSFVTSKADPEDYDGCWDRAGVDLSKLQASDPTLLDFTNRRMRQKVKYGGEMFPADLLEGQSGLVFVEFFERDKNTGDPKGLVEIDLRGLS